MCLLPGEVQELMTISAFYVFITSLSEWDGEKFPRPSGGRVKSQRDLLIGAGAPCPEVAIFEGQQEIGQSVNLKPP